MEKKLEELIERNRRKDTVAELTTALEKVTTELENASRLLQVYQTPINEITEIVAPEDDCVDYAVALALISDNHLEHKVTLESTNGINEHNPEIAIQRTENIFTRLAKRINKNRKEVLINNLVVGILGDLIHGFIHEEYMRTNYMTPTEAQLFAVEQFERGFKYLRNNVDEIEITCVCKVGNHSRQSRKIYTDEEGLYSFEWAIYHTLKKLFPDINWVIDNSYYTYLDVYGKVLRFSHGHEINYQGGIGGIYVPLQRNRLRANQIRKADLDCLGHFHTTDFLRNSGVLMNGSGVGADPYSIRKGFEPEPPMQQFLLIDKKRGFTVNEPILLT